LGWLSEAEAEGEDRAIASLEGNDPGGGCCRRRGHAQMTNKLTFPLLLRHNSSDYHILEVETPMTMKPTILDTSLQAYRLRMEELVKNLHQMTIDTAQERLAEMVSALRNTLHEPFLFVIVGEVKAGKSSFINALLGSGEEICKVAPDPCTDTVQQLMYGAEAREIYLNEHLKKILQPVEILKHISVVDTPGTNTISAHHQEITERFIPQSDLVVFVFEAKNPYRQSAWEFFDFIHKDWQKKVIFVLQQSDLMEPADLQINLEGLERYAQKKGIPDPTIFAVSAKLELAGKSKESGFQPLQNYLLENITGRNASLLKLFSNIETARTINGQVYTRLEKMEGQLKMDREFRADVIQSLQEQQEQSQRQIDTMIRGLLNEYDLITQAASRKLANGLGFFSLTKKSIASVFSKGDSPQAWLQGLTRNLELELDRTFTHQLQEGVESLAESIGQMAKIIDLKIQNSQTVLKPNQEIFGAISEQRRTVLRGLQEKFADFMAHTEHFVGAEVFPEAEKFSPNIAAGSGIAVIGVVLAAATQITALDITGGILSTAGLLFAGGTVLIKRGKIVKGFSAEIESGRNQLRKELETKLKAYVSHIRGKIDENFENFDSLLAKEGQQVEQLANEQSALSYSLNQMEKELSESN
jgi:ribosome biogenesis GTPase A